MLKNWFAVLFIALSLCLQAGVLPERQIDSVHTSHNTATVTLNDGTSWNLSFNSVEKELVKTWKKGDMVAITPLPFKKGLGMMNEELAIMYLPRVTPTEQTKTGLPRIEKIDQCEEKNSWGNAEYRITLSDQTIWSLETFDREENDDFSVWKEGDLVMVGDDCSEKERTLINLNVINTSDFQKADLLVKIAN